MTVAKLKSIELREAVKYFFVHSGSSAGARGLESVADAFGQRPIARFDPDYVSTGDLEHGGKPEESKGTAGKRKLASGESPLPSLAMYS